MIRKVTILLIALVACPSLAACGGSDDKSSSDSSGGSASTSDSGLSRTELATKADAICKTGEDDAATVTAPSDFSDATAAEDYFAKVVPLHQKQTDALAALSPDDEAKADWDAFIKTQNDNQALLDSILAKAKAKDPSGEKDIEQIVPLAQKFSAAATKLGSSGCAGSA